MTGEVARCPSVGAAPPANCRVSSSAVILPEDKSTMACAICSSVFEAVAGPVVATAIASTVFEALVGRAMDATVFVVVLPPRVFP